MKVGTKVSMGMAVLAAVGTIGFAPAVADKAAPVASVQVTMTAVVLAAPETPQDQVWDMTYGAEQPPLDQDTQPETLAEGDAIVDYTFG